MSAGEFAQGYSCLFLVKDPKFVRFYLPPKIHKRIQEDQVISNCGYYTENISSFLNCHFPALAQKVKS